MIILLFFHVDRKEQIEKAEEKERLQKEEEEKKRKEAEEEAKEKSKVEMGANQEKTEVTKQVGSKDEHDDIGLLDQVRGLVVCLSCLVIAL